jgi:hypothetical protein
VVEGFGDALPPQYSLFLALEEPRLFQSSKKKILGRMKALQTSLDTLTA